MALLPVRVELFYRDAGAKPPCRWCSRSGIYTRNMEAYLRKMAIDGYIIQIDHADIKAMTAEIQKIGVNVNQIAKRVNATGSVYQEDIEEIKEVLAEIWRLQRLSLLKAR